MPNIRFNKAFWKWFEDSKVVDGKGAPLVVYHGTVAPEAFTEFLIGERFYNDDSGFHRRESGADPTSYIGPHFTSDLSIAERFAEGLYGEREHQKGMGGRIFPAFLSIQKPFDTTEEQILKQVFSMSYDCYGVDSTLDNFDGTESNYLNQMQLYKLYDSNVNFRSKINRIALAWDTNSDDNFFELAETMGNNYKQRLEMKGYDGLRYKNKIEGGFAIVPFEAWQIKSVHNAGTWSKATGNILNPYD